MKGDVRTYYREGQWISKIDGEPEPKHRGGTKEEQVEFGRNLARERKVEHIICTMQGRVAEKNSYGNDPRGNG